jgi:hypothetical protein
MPFLPTQYKYTMRLPSFDGGLNTKYTNIGTPINCTPDCQNVLFDDYGAVRTAYGYAKFNSTQIASSPIDGLGQFVDVAANKVIIAACNGSIYAESAGTFSVISGATNIYTAGIDVGMTLASSKLMFYNGYIPVYQYDGTYFNRFGPQEPIGSASVASGAVGLLNGTYNWALTYITSAGVESDYKQIIASFPIASGVANISGIQTAPASYGVNSVNLYRTTAAASATYWLATAMSAGQTSVVDSAADSALIVEAPSDQGIPPQAKYMVYYRGRLWAAGVPATPYRLYYSNSGDIQEWPSTNYTDVEEGDGDPISGIEAFGNAIIIHKNDGKGNGSIYLLYIADSTGVSDDTNWYLFKSPAAFSAVSDKSQEFFKNLLFYIGRFGAYAFTGQDLARSSADSEYGRFQNDSLTWEIDPDVKTWLSTQLNKSAAVMYDNKIWAAVPTGGSTTQNNKIYVFDFLRSGDDSGKLGVWSKLSGPNVNNFVVSDGVLYGGGYDGYVYKLNTGTLNDGTAISPYYWTAALAGQNEHRYNTKIFRVLYVTHDCPGNWLLYVDYEVEFSGVSTTATIDLNGGGSMWGIMQWTNSKWGGGNTTKRSRVILTNAIGKTIKFKFYLSGLNQTFKIKELELDYNLRSKR